MALDRNLSMLYKKLVNLYPRRFRERFGESMQQTFNDLYKERSNGSDGSSFMLGMFVETAMGILQEHILVISEGDSMKTISSNPGSAALIGFLCSLPFIVMNALVANQVHPFLLFIRPDGHTSTFEYGLLAFVLLLLPLGAFIAILPMLRKERGGDRKLYIFNIILAIILSAGFVMISFGLGSDIYQCDVLKIPNCD
jgi:hypothetical protein